MPHICGQDTDDPLPFATGQNDLGRHESGQSYLHKSANRWEMGFGALSLQPCSHAECCLHWHPKRSSTQGIVTTEMSRGETDPAQDVKRAWNDYCHFDTINQDDIPSCPSALLLQSRNNSPMTPSLKLKKSGVYWLWFKNIFFFKLSLDRTLCIHCMVQKGSRKNTRPECHVPRATYLVIQNFLGGSRGDELNFWE